MVENISSHRKIRNFFLPTTYYFIKTQTTKPQISGSSFSHLHVNLKSYSWWFARNIWHLPNGRPAFICSNLCFDHFFSKKSTLKQNISWCVIWNFWNIQIDKKKSFFRCNLRSLVNQKSHLHGLFYYFTVSSFCSLSNCLIS